jgi:hypothetical protein
MTLASRSQKAALWEQSGTSKTSSITKLFPLFPPFPVVIAKTHSAVEISRSTEQ